MNNNETTWKPVPGYEGLYEVSDDGQVRSLISKGKILRPSTRNGYQRVGLSKEGKRTNFPVHRLVLLAFVGPAPEGAEACHWNDDPLENRLTNLRWGSKSENTLDKVRNGRDWNANKTHCPRGHSLSLPDNLKPSSLKVGWRKCLCCDRAHAWAHKRTSDPALKEIYVTINAAERYAELLRSGN